MPSRQKVCCSGVEPRLFARRLEKIGFQCFVRYQPLQLRHLKPEFTFPAVFGRRLTIVDRLDLIAPLADERVDSAGCFFLRTGQVFWLAGTFGGFAR
jgi:hypothetical protein